MIPIDNGFGKLDDFSSQLLFHPHDCSTEVVSRWHFAPFCHTPLPITNFTRMHPTIFLHIPKAGGTTLRHILVRQVQPAQAFLLYERMETAGAEVARLEQLPATQKAELQLLAGHFRFGLHRLLPQPFRYVTFLRDPYQRVVSQYHHVHRRPDHYLYPEVVERGLSLEAFLREGLAVELDNGQTRLLGTDFDQPDTPIGVCDMTMLQRAKDRLDQAFAVVGLQERFDESLLLIQERLGIRSIAYQPKNQDRRRTARQPLSANEKAAVEQTHALDLELYAYAYAKLKAEIEQRPDFFVQGVQRLAAQNKRYAWQVRVNRKLKTLFGAS